MTAERAEIAWKVGLAVGGLCVGGLGGYFVAKKQLESKYAEIADAEIQDVKEHYSKLRKEGDYSDPAKAVEKAGINVEWVSEHAEELRKLREQLQEQGYDGSSETEVSTGDDPSVEVTVNVFQKSEDEPDPDLNDLGVPWDHPDWDPEKRDTDLPYPITIHEFHDSEHEFDKITITYYEEDDTLSDERDEIIPDVVMTVGQENLKRFGQGSQDRNIVYVRNERLRTDFEIARSEGSYAAAVLGLTQDGD